MIRLKQLRKEQKVTQIELAQMLNVKQTTISNWENEITEIDQQSLFKLADYFNVSVDYLLGRDADPERDEKPQIHIPDKYKDVLVAFHGGADDLTQEDVDKVIEYIELLRTKNRIKK